MRINNISKGYIRMQCNQTEFVCSLPAGVTRIVKVIAFRDNILTALCRIKGMSSPVLKYIDLSMVRQLCDGTGCVIKNCQYSVS